MEKFAESLIEFKEKLAEWQRGVRSPDDLAAVPVLVEDLVRTCPPSGEGVHQWFAQAAYVLCRRWPFSEHLTLEESHDIMERAALSKGRTPKPGEIEEAINFVLGRGRPQSAESGKKTPPSKERKEPKFKRRTLKIACTPRAVEILVKESPVKEPWALEMRQVLQRRFPPLTRLLFNFDKYSSVVREIGDLTPLWRPELLVPNAWIGRLSQREVGLRGFENFGDQWCYQVTDFDHGSLDLQASKIRWLRRQRGSPKLAMVLFSGKKSFHAWWEVQEMSPGEREDFFALAVGIGADPAHQKINQLVRSPNSVRSETGRRQGVAYLA